MSVTTSVPSTMKTATRTRLFTPGPVEIPFRVLRALTQIPPHHRTDAFREQFKRVTEGLRQLHGTRGEVFILASSGTGAMQATVTNIMAPGEKALAIVGGKFGERWAKLLTAFDVPNEVIEVEWGTSLDPADIAKKLEADKNITTVYTTYSETSTGTLYDIKGFSEVTRKHGRRLVVDAITGLGVHELPQDEWGIDVVVCGSQKGLMVPPGLATVSLAPWARDYIEGKKLPRYYFDLQMARKMAPNGETPFTPAVTLVIAMEEALKMIEEEGLPNVIERHRRLANAMRAGAEAVDFKLFSKSPANSVTALYPPDGVSAADVVKRLRDMHGMIVAGGQGHLKGKILRVGHMGAYDLFDIVSVSTALEECANTFGHPGRGAAGEARRSWDEV